jgi:hypothetical protein
MALVGARSVQAQTTTPDQIAKFFDAFGTTTDSVVSENSQGNVGIGGPPSSDIGFLLRLSAFQNGRTVYTQVENTGPFSAAGIRLKTLVSDWAIIGTDDGAGNPDAFRIANLSSGTFLNIKADTGNVGIGTATSSSPTAKLQVAGGDAAISTQGNGLVLRATNGPNCFRVTVNNAGALSTSPVTCP